MDTDIGRSAELSATRARHLVPGEPVAFLICAEPEAAALVVRGSLVGTALDEFGSAMEQALRSHERRFVVDVAAVDQWSLIAQAMLLTTARRKAARGELLVLRGATPALREQSRRLGLFDRVDTTGATRLPDSPPEKGKATGGTRVPASRAPGGA